MKKIKVLHVIKSLGRGGAEMLLPETLAVHDKAKFEFHYIYFLPWKNQMVKAIQENDGIVSCLPAKNNLQIILSVFKLVSYIKKNKIQIIHCHLPWAGIAGRLAGSVSRVPVIYTEHNKWERYHKLTYALNKISFGLQQLVIAVSDEVRESILKGYRKPTPVVTTILNGVNTTKFSRNSADQSVKQQLNIQEATVVIGTVSVFRVQKRLDRWLEVAATVHKKHPKTFFIVVGDGPLRADIEAKARALEMEDYIHFAGLQEEVRPYFEAMDIFMMASQFEGLPIALLEAMSMGCIPVCTTAGGIPEVITHGVDGLLCDVDEPGKLAVELDGLLSNFTGLQSGLSTAARQRIVDGFSMNRMVNELEAVYSRILRGV